MKFMMVLAAAAMSVAAFAQGPVRPAGGGAAMMSIEPVVRMALNPKMAEKIGVTEEQAAKLKALPDDREALKSLHEKAKKGMERQAELLKAEKIDEAAVMAALEETWNARKEVAKLQTKRLVAVRAILSAEQIAKARETMKSMRGQGNRPKGPKCEGKKGSKATADKDGKTVEG